MDAKPKFERWEIAFAAIVFTVGLAIRFRLALLTYLNPDEIEVALAALGGWRRILNQALEFAHPPLLVLLTGAVSRISRNEWALRLIPVLAGSFFPLLLFFWLRRLAGNIAAATVLLLLTLSPYPIDLSVQLRSYTLALFLVSACLLVLEKALETGRWQIMAGYSVLLWLCILADYSTAWFVGAAGVYGLLRYRGLPARAGQVWAAGQCLALVLYGGLFALQVSNVGGDSNIALDAINGWLRDEFPQPGRMLWFPFVNTLGQFEFLLASAPAGWLGAALFAAALFLLWTGRTSVQRNRARPLAALLMLPFLLAIGGAYARQFPYGPTRHTIVVGLFGAAGIAVFVGALPRRAGLWMVGGMLLLAPLWSLVEVGEEIPFERHQKWQILQCLDYMRATVPAGALVFTERETLNILAYYAGHEEILPWPAQRQSFSENLLAARWRVAARDYIYATRKDYEDALAAFRRQYALADSEPVWVLDGGWTVVSGPADPRLPFSKAVRVFQAGGLPGLSGQHGF